MAVMMAYANILDAPFVFDDYLTVLDNPTIRDWRQLRAVLAPPRELPVAGRPLVNLSFAANYALGGVAVAGYHLVNIAIHLCNALLLLGIVRRTLRAVGPEESGTEASFRRHSLWLAFAVALLWALHPLNTDAVSYTTQRTELLAAGAYLLTLYCSIRALQPADSSGRWSAVAVAACAAGMACKESMVTAPLMVIAYDLVFAGPPRRTVRRRRWFYTALAATWLVLAVVSPGARVHSAGLDSGVTPWTYLLNQALIIPRYLLLAFWPRALVLLYGAPQPLSVGQVWPQFALMAALVGSAGLMVIRAPRAGFLALWFFVTLAPASSIVPIATEVGAERRMYLPLIALIVPAVLVAFRRLPPRLLLAAAALGGCALLLGLGTWDRNRDYASALRLARTSVDRYPSAVGQQGLGVELIKAGRSDEGIALLREATAQEPRARFSLGVELFRRQQWDEAVRELEAFVRLKPDLLEAVTARQLLGRAFAARQQWPEAIAQHRRVLDMKPTTVQRLDSEALLAEALFHTEQFEESAAIYQRYLAMRPDDIIALTNCGIALATLGRLPPAIILFERIVTVDPRNGEGRRNLATALSDAGRPEQALPHAEQAVALRPNDAAAHLLLAQLLAGIGRTGEAQVHARRAAELDPASALR